MRLQIIYWFIGFRHRVVEFPFDIKKLEDRLEFITYITNDIPSNLEIAVMYCTIHFEGEPENKKSFYCFTDGDIIGL